MFNFLERLRQKTPAARVQIAIVTSLFFTGAIFVMWLFIAKERLNNAFENIATPTEEILPGFGGNISEIETLFEERPLLFEDAN